MDSIRDLVVAVSSLLVAISALAALREYDLKLTGEKRLQESAASEIDTRISKLFVELMWLAEGRAGSQLSETCVEALLQKGVITEKELRDTEEPAQQLQKDLQEAVVSLPVGRASQDAAIISLGILGGRYEILAKPAMKAINGLKEFKREQAEEALTVLREEQQKRL